MLKALILLIFCAHGLCHLAGTGDRNLHRKVSRVSSSAVANDGSNDFHPDIDTDDHLPFCLRDSLALYDASTGDGSKLSTRELKNQEGAPNRRTGRAARENLVDAAQPTGIISADDNNVYSGTTHAAASDRLLRVLHSHGASVFRASKTLTAKSRHKATSRSQKATHRSGLTHITTGGAKTTRKHATSLTKSKTLSPTKPTVAVSSNTTAESPYQTSNPLSRPRLTPSSSLPPSWSLYDQCLLDSPKVHLLNSTVVSSNVTPETCVTFCDAAAYLWAGVENGNQCWCGNTLRINYHLGAGQMRGPEMCSMPCSGDASKVCGGSNTMTVYSKASANQPSTTGSAPPFPTIPWSSPKAYRLVETMEGATFFDHFNFYSSSDPTHGLVTYVNRSYAGSQGLAYVSPSGQAGIRVDNTTVLPVGAPRDSVRIESKNAWSTGLFVFDIERMPYGCSLWPAMWMLGPTWPNTGEIDIIEGINSFTNNHLTMHTATDSKCSNFGTSKLQATDDVGPATACASSNYANDGCSFVDPDPNSYGEGLNTGGGAVFAVRVASDGASIWRFRRGTVPIDLLIGLPAPALWGVPGAAWPSMPTCNISKVLSTLRIVINISLCGDWAGALYGSSGCPGTCAQQVSEPENFDNGDWAINTIKIYQEA